MLLSNAQIATVKQQAEIDPVPADHAFAEALAERFGKHTFYLGNGGLYIAEPFGLDVPEGEPVVFVRVAEWADEDRSQLKPIPPERLEHAVDLAATA